MWLGLDDTDSPRGGCTTWVLTELLALARELQIDLLGYPRLVRLNPNIPWKTRGNAALSARFGHGQGPRTRVGVISGRPIWSYRRGRPLGGSTADSFREAAWRLVNARSRSEAGTDPALVIAPRRLPAEFYWRAVRDVVPASDARSAIETAGGWWRTRDDDRGLVGAAASIAWPGRRVTWEVTSYRRPERWGRPRDVDAQSVREASNRHAGLFLCADPRTRRLLVAPHTPCPILYGLRGTEPRPLLSARRDVRSEPVDRWVLFRTNQATGDHLADRDWASVAPYGSARFNATVCAAPADLPGGHVCLPLRDDRGSSLDCLAFEPTKTLPRAVRALAPGDRVRVAGSRGVDPVLRLETLQVLRLARRWSASRPPRCPACHRRARSLGQARGYRCPGCHRRWPPESSIRETRPPPQIQGVVVHPTASARRHLHPLAPEI